MEGDFAQEERALARKNGASAKMNGARAEKNGLSAKRDHRSAKKDRARTQTAGAQQLKSMRSSTAEDRIRGALKDPPISAEISRAQFGISLAP